jgi:hypothetical protein
MDWGLDRVVEVALPRGLLKIDIVQWLHTSTLSLTIFVMGTFHRIPGNHDIYAAEIKSLPSRLEPVMRVRFNSPIER